MIAGKKILVVDDAEEIRMFLRIALTAAGFQVSEAVDGVDGVEAVSRNVPDAVILDIMMPRMDGFEAYQAINANTPLLPTLFLSAMTSAKAEVDSLPGRVSFMAKPFDPVKVIAWLHQNLSENP